MHFTTIFTTAKRSKYSLSQSKADIQYVLDAIKTGSYTDPQTGEHFDLITLTKEARNIIILHGKDSDEYSAHKLKFPAFIPNGFYTSDTVFSDRNFSTAGLIYVDLDDQDGQDDKLKAIPSLHAYWRSTSGRGYSCLFRVMNYDRYDIKNVIQAIRDQYGLINCKKAMKQAQPCLMPYAPDMYSVYHLGGTEQINIQDVIDTSIIGDYVFDYSLFRDKYSVDDNYTLGGTEQINIKKGEDRVVKDPLNGNLNKWSYAKPIINIESWAEGQDFKLYPEPRQVIDLYPTRINTGYRNKALLSIGAKCIALFHHHGGLSREETYKRFARHNNLCEEPLPMERIQHIFNSLWKQYEAGDLHVQTRTKYGEVNPNYPLAADKDSGVMSKRKASGKLSGAVRAARAQDAIRTAIGKLKDEGKKITKEAISEKVGKKPTAIKRQWKQFKVEIEEYNAVLSSETHPVRNSTSEQPKSEPAVTLSPEANKPLEPVKVVETETIPEETKTINMHGNHGNTGEEFERVYLSVKKYYPSLKRTEAEAEVNETYLGIKDGRLAVFYKQPNGILWFCGNVKDAA